MKFSKIHVDIVDTFEKFQGERVKSFSQFVVENLDPTLNESDYQKEVDARVKVHRNLLWINARKGFFAQLLSKLNIYGVSDPRYQTMCTNGFNIQYHPDFVLGQSDPAIRFVLCHEILHCVGDHMSRRGSRDPLLWNYACDYAINPILNVEIVGGAFEWPANLDGSRMGLYEEKYEGMKAEDIYDLLVDDKQQQEKADEAFKDDPQKGMHVIDADEDLGEPNEESVVQEVSDEEGGDKPEVNLEVDHDHNCCNKAITCGECVRGIICPKCNVNVHKYEINVMRSDNPKINMIRKYLEGYRAKR
jgi:hypothetical protein